MKLKCEYVEGLDVEWTIDYDDWFVGCVVLVSADVHLGSCRCNGVKRDTSSGWSSTGTHGKGDEPTERVTASDVIGRSTRVLPLSHGLGYAVGRCL